VFDFGVSSKLIHIKKTGSINHYYHYIVDFLWPVNYWLESIGKEKSDIIHIYTNDKEALHFNSISQNIFGVRVEKNIAKVFFNVCSMNISYKKIQGFNTNTGAYLREFASKSEIKRSLLKLRNDVINNIDIKNHKVDEEVIILIERTFSNEDRGAARRYILNHNNLKKDLSDYCKEKNITLLNLKLEELDFISQVEAFKKCRFVVGQHGAGLLNIIWGDYDSISLIELAKDRSRNHFRNLCEVAGVEYLHLQFENKGGEDKEIIDVNSNYIISIINDRLNNV
jgi:hypothetical protein